MASQYFNAVTDPREYLRPEPASSKNVFREPAKTLDQAFANTSDVLDGKGAKIGIFQPDYQIMLAARQRELMDRLGRAPSREESLTDLLLTAHPDWPLDKLFALGCNDADANQVVLKATLTTAIQQRSVQRAAQPRPNRAPAPAPVATPATPATPATANAVPIPVRPDILVTAAIGGASFRFPIKDWVAQDRVLVLVQDSNSPYLWSPSDTEQVIGLTVGNEDIFAATWSGISYPVGHDTHTILVLE